MIAAIDYVRAVPELVRTYVPCRAVPRRAVTLGTDGFGRSDTRQALREFFEVDRASIVIAGLKALADDGEIESALACRALQHYGKSWFWEAGSKPGVTLRAEAGNCCLSPTDGTLTMDKS